MTKGFYNGFTYGWPTPIGGVGGGLYVDNYGNAYPQLYYGTPRAGGSTGYSPDLEGLLTGASISASSGTGMIRHNFGKSGNSGGVDLGTPGIGVTYGFGPYNVPEIIGGMRSGGSTIDAAGEANPAIYGFDLAPAPFVSPAGGGGPVPADPSRGARFPTPNDGPRTKESRSSLPVADPDFRQLSRGADSQSGGIGVQRRRAGDRLTSAEPGTVFLQRCLS